jgi:cytoskeletal protein RodZ
MRLEDLPSRPFTIGYVRAYARALNLNPDEMVERFKQDAPEETDDLQAPIGVEQQSDPRAWLIGCGAAVLVAAVVIWNLAQHATSTQRPSGSIAADPAPAVASAQSPSVVTLSAATPPPQESTLPAPYQTPGLGGAPSAPAPSGSAGGGVSEAVQPATFAAHGAVYGAAVGASAVTLQAKKSASLVIRSPDGAVYFAQQLKAGEAYRAPAGRDLTIDVSDPTAFAVYQNGVLKPTGLTGPLTSLSSLTPQAGGA